MSKEEMIPAEDEITAAHERIEELERELFNTEADRQLQLELKTTYMRELNELERERDSFYMDYRMKCDEGTKALQADNARLREALDIIAGTDPLEAALDPQRAVRVARNALAKVRKP